MILKLMAGLAMLSAWLLAFNKQKSNIIAGTVYYSIMALAFLIVCMAIN